MREQNVKSAYEVKMRIEEIEKLKLEIQEERKPDKLNLLDKEVQYFKNALR